MHDKVITALLAILIALGGWTLSRTFSLSQDMVLIKEKVSGIENEIQDAKTFKKKKRRKKKNTNDWKSGTGFDNYPGLGSSSFSWM